MTILIFIIILAVLIFVHELGHFLAAKLCGVRVDEFALGFPPRLFGFKKGETQYALNLIPFGGYVKIFGEDPTEETTASDPRSFTKKPKYIQAIILLAGIFFNLVFAWLLLTSSVIIGVDLPAEYAAQTGTATRTVISGVIANSPAEKAGLQAGDVLVSAIAPHDNLGPSSSHVDDIRGRIADAGSEATPVTINYLRSGREGSAMITPETDETGQYRIGIAMQETSLVKSSLGRALWQGALMTGSITKLTVTGLVYFVGQIFHGQAHVSDVSGPVGIAVMTGQAEKIGFSYLLLFTAFISINLAVLNVIPFPALDGGRLLLVIIEKIKGSPIKPSVAAAINTVGFGLLILLMLVVTYHDIVRLFVK